MKFSVIEKAQELEGLTPLKVLKCATTRWLSYGAATQRIISRFSPLIEALNTIYFEKHDANVKGVRDLLLRSNVILFMLFLADVLVYVNRFLRFLQNIFLGYSTISGKPAQLINNLEKLQSEERFYFKQHGRRFLENVKERLELHGRHINMTTKQMLVSTRSFNPLKKQKCNRIQQL